MELEISSFEFAFVSYWKNLAEPVFRGDMQIFCNSTSTYKVIAIRGVKRLETCYPKKMCIPRRKLLFVVLPNSSNLGRQLVQNLLSISF
jgi:hypothetical protein